MNYRAPAELVQVEVRVAEVEQAGTELVLLGLAILLDEPMCLKSLQQPVDGGTGDPEAIGELAYAEAPRPAGERPKDPRRPIDGLDRSFRSAGLGAWSGSVWEFGYSALSNRLR